MIKRVHEILNESILTKEKLLNDAYTLEQIIEVVRYSVNCFNQKGKLLLCGNGGSAADAQHIAAELSGRFQIDRPPLFAEALHVNTSYLTAVANDYSFDRVYARMVEASGREGDLLIGLSTSGNSINVLEAFKVAKNLGMTTIALTGIREGKIDAFSDIIIKAPSTVTARIQECHITIGHILCELIEYELFGK
jgi:D-sedoheptulose 7-phosphate isomerase